jgi:hypothetical protein
MVRVVIDVPDAAYKLLRKEHLDAWNNATDAGEDKPSSFEDILKIYLMHGLATDVYRNEVLTNLRTMSKHLERGIRDVEDLDPIDFDVSSELFGEMLENEYH